MAGLLGVISSSFTFHAGCRALPASRMTRSQRCLGKMPPDDGTAERHEKTPECCEIGASRKKQRRALIFYVDHGWHLNEFDER